MKKMLRASQGELDRFRLALLQEQIKYCYNNVPFYRRTMESKNLRPGDFKKLEDLGNLPVIYKEVVRKDYSQFISKKIKIGQCRKSFSSGTTGEPFWSYFDRMTWLRKKYLLKLRARRICGLQFWQKVAVFETEPVEKLLKLNKKIYFNTPLLRVRYFSKFEKIGSILPALRDFNPHNIYCAPSYAFELTRAIEKERIKLKNLQRIFTSSEYLEQTVRTYIESTLDVPVFDLYGSTEFKEVAWECKKREGYHINEDQVIVEIIKNGHSAQAEEIGEIVLTDLRNKAMPLIRFKIKDRGMFLSQRCSCGIPFSLMKPVSGRTTECIELPNGERISQFRLTTAVEHVPGLLKYQIIQSASNQLIVKVIFDSGYNEDSMMQVESIIRDITSEYMAISVELCQNIDNDYLGKYKVVKRLDR
jgi:phenylacetate-CoA ligase